MGIVSRGDEEEVGSEEMGCAVNGGGWLDGRKR